MSQNAKKTSTPCTPPHLLISPGSEDYHPVKVEYSGADMVDGSCRCGEEKTDVTTGNQGDRLTNASLVIPGATSGLKRSASSKNSRGGYNSPNIEDSGVSRRPVEDAHSCSQAPIETVGDEEDEQLGADTQVVEVWSTSHSANRRGSRVVR